MDGDKQNCLIVIRGPSGSGKSTVAERVFKCASSRTVLIQQDYYRFIFNPSGGGSKPNSPVIHRMIQENCISCLEAGYDVILEGILSSESYKHVLKRIISAHEGPCCLFYLDVSFKETARRHRTRESSADFTVEDMRQWYDSSSRLNHPLEHVIDQSLSETEACQFIQDSIIGVKRSV